MPKFLKVLPFVVVIALPILVLAAAPTVTNISTVSDVYTALRGILNVVYTIFFIIAAIFIILAAFSYLTAAGDEEKVKSAKQKVIYAIVAIVVALLAFSASAIVANLIGAGQTIQ